MAPVVENVEVNGFSSKKKDEADNKDNLWYMCFTAKIKQI
jgi:hypothetical protein